MWLAQSHRRQSKSRYSSELTTDWFFSFPFKGKVGMGMGFGREIETTDCVTITHPHPSPPLEREGTFSGAPTCVDTDTLKGQELPGAF